jgi:Concanavalin A-like lectin/glucanases superfamily/Domain of unknown function (DUF2341)/Carbohydrate esterase, sialic acid-specific acetylesterase
MNQIKLAGLQSQLAMFGVLVIQFAGFQTTRGADPPARTNQVYEAWKHSGSLFILTSPEGADLPESAVVENFPLLVRLNQDSFDFQQAQPNGEDLRFSTSNGEPLAFQIEEWDSAKGVASIWVRVPRIQGNSRQEVKIYWGHPAAKSESSGKAVFNESNGYVSVWHMNDVVQDDVGTLPSVDNGTTIVAGMIGKGRNLPGERGVFGGDKIRNYPSGSSSHSSEAWFRAVRPNTTILGWGNEGGGRGSKVRMQLRSPPHVHIDSDFSDVNGEGDLPLGEWIHVIHTYDRDDGRIYINGNLDGAAKPRLNIKSPSRLWIGGWYDNYDFVGDIDEVRISRVARSAFWIKLQYENQKHHQTVVGTVVQPGTEFSVTPFEASVAEGQSVTLSAHAGGAQKVFWVMNRDGRETVVATNQFSYMLNAGRVTEDSKLAMQFKAIYADDVKSKIIPITIKEAISDPQFTLHGPTDWDGRQTIEIVPEITNLAAMREQDAVDLKYEWLVDGVAVIKQIATDKLILERAQGSGVMTVSVSIDNGGKKVTGSTVISVNEPAHDVWVEREPAKTEQPEDNQFFARNDKNEGTVNYSGTLLAAADSVFLKVYADGKLVDTLSGNVSPSKEYSLSAKLKPGLIHYQTKFGSKSGDRETELHLAKNLVCGDAFLIDGQSNAEATDVGPKDPAMTSDWIRSYGSMGRDPSGGRLNRWGNAVVRDQRGGKAQIGYWGFKLAEQLVESQKIPICIINGAVGGSRIDQHQRNDHDPTDASTIYGRSLWRIQQAKLTHGIRAVLWHQGENDQGADGPSGGFGWQTYRQHFIDMAADWKEDYPNIQHYYVFQIWPKACAMGIKGSDNQLREIQRTLPRYFSNLSVMSTLGIKPPGGCHFPVEGYAEFARLIGPLVERDLYLKKFEQPIHPPNLTRAWFTTSNHDELVLEFDCDIFWSEKLASQFSIDGVAGQIHSGSAENNRLTLKLNGTTNASKVSYLDSDHWNPDNLLYGKNGIAALTFCDVAID